MLKTKILAAGAVALVAAGCASEPRYERYGEGYYSSPRYASADPYYHGNGAYADYGRVVAIDVVRDRGTSGAGAVVGGIVGGVLGHQIGSGRGNDLATAAGAIGGAVAGNEIERRRNNREEHYRVIVQLRDGREATFHQDHLYGIRVGDRVRVDGGRVVPD